MYCNGPDEILLGCVVLLLAVADCCAVRVLALDQKTKKHIKVLYTHSEVSGKWSRHSIRQTVMISNLVSILLRLVLLLVWSSRNSRADVDLQTDSSGWRVMDSASAKLLNLDFDYCTLDRIPVSEMTEERFEREYRGRKPCVISNLTDSWAAQKLWKRSSFMKKFGQRQVEVDETKVFESYGGSKSLKTMAEYIQNDLKSITTSRVLDLVHKKNTTPLQYSFYNFDDGSWNELIEESPVPLLFQFIDESKGHVNQLAVGATGTGLSWHSHHDAWNSIIFGKKLWLIADPKGPAPAGTGLFSTDDDPHCCNAITWHAEEHRRRRSEEIVKNSATPTSTPNYTIDTIDTIDTITTLTTTTTINNNNNNNNNNTAIEGGEKKWQDKEQGPGKSTWDFGSQAHVHQCIVHTGEAVYVPARWAHATMNIGDTIARSQRAGTEDMDNALIKYSSSIITFDLDHSGRFGVNRKEGIQEYIHLNELLDNNALELICDSHREYGLRRRTFKFMTSIVKKVDRALKKMVRNMKTTMPSKVHNQIKVREHFQGSNLQLREYKTRMGTCYMKDLYRSSDQKRQERAGVSGKSTTNTAADDL